MPIRAQLPLLQHVHSQTHWVPEKKDLWGKQHLWKASPTVTHKAYANELFTQDKIPENCFMSLKITFPFLGDPLRYGSWILSKYTLVLSSTLGESSSL